MDTDQTWLQFKLHRTLVVKLIRIRKKEYYDRLIDHNKDNSTTMWKTLKHIVTGETNSTKEIDDIDFEILGNTRGYNIADNFTLYFIRSIGDIV